MHVLNTTFNEEHYDFFVRIVEKVARKILKKTGKRPNNRDVFRKLPELKAWKEIKGLIYEDKPKNDLLQFDGLQYKKRVQLAVYDETIIESFCFKEAYKV